MPISPRATPPPIHNSPAGGAVSTPPATLAAGATALPLPPSSKRTTSAQRQAPAWALRLAVLAGLSLFWAVLAAWLFA